MPLRISRASSVPSRFSRSSSHGEEAVLLPVGFLTRFREACEFVPLCDDLPPLTVEIEEDIGLGAQHVGFDRLLDEVYGARFIAAEAPGDVGAACGNEDDRDMTRTLVGAHDFGEFEPVHAGHASGVRRSRAQFADVDLFGRSFNADLEMIGLDDIDDSSRPISNDVRAAPMAQAVIGNAG